MEETIGMELSTMEMSYCNIFEAAIAEANAEDGLGKMTIYIPDSSSKVEKV